jgi:hypothetical protein
VPRRERGKLREEGGGSLRVQWLGVSREEEIRLREDRGELELNKTKRGRSLSLHRERILSRLGYLIGTKYYLLVPVGVTNWD